MKVVVFFTANIDWQQIADKYDDLSKEHTDVVFNKVNVDEVTAAKDEVSSIPSFKFYKIGYEVASVIEMNIDAVQAIIHENE